MPTLFYALLGVIQRPPILPAGHTYATITDPNATLFTFSVVCALNFKVFWVFLLFQLFFNSMWLYANADAFTDVTVGTNANNRPPAGPAGAGRRDPVRLQLHRRVGSGDGAGDAEVRRAAQALIGAPKGPRDGAAYRLISLSRCGGAVTVAERVCASKLETLRCV